MFRVTLLHPLTHERDCQWCPKGQGVGAAQFNVHIVDQERRRGWKVCRTCLASARAEAETTLVA